MPHTPPSPDILILFAGGGTGGHLFPTLAIAESLRNLLGPRLQCRFLCSSRPIDASILARERVDFTPAPAAPPSPRPRALLRFLRGWGPSVRLARQQIRAARKSGQRTLLVASGGFVAAPLVQGARAEHCPILMLNLDAVPGKANRWIARHATRIMTTTRVADRHAAAPRRQWTLIPPIVRQSAVADGSPAECRRAFGLDPDRPTLLITGGSQGAASINGFMAAFVEKHAAALDGWQIIHQTGGQSRDSISDADRAREAYSRAGIPAHIAEFLSNMGQAWGAADLCVCRSGAGNVGEAWATRTPCLFMPYPYHKDEHQRANAMPLVEAGAGVLAHDAIDPAANLEEAGTALAELLREAPARARIREALTALGPADGAERVAAAIVELLEPPR